MSFWSDKDGPIKINIRPCTKEEGEDQDWWTQHRRKREAEAKAAFDEKIADMMARQDVPQDVRDGVAGLASWVNPQGLISMDAVLDAVAGKRRP